VCKRGEAVAQSCMFVGVMTAYLPGNSKLATQVHDLSDHISCSANPLGILELLTNAAWVKHKMQVILSSWEDLHELQIILMNAAESRVCA
jgi:hypothetical protein